MFIKAIFSKSKQTDRVPRHSTGFWISLALLLITFDYLTKAAAEWFGWELFLNDKFAFSLPLPLGLIYVLYLITFGLIFHYLITHRTEISLALVYGFVFILAGGIANVFERMILGHVRDFIFLANGVFNIADVYIFFGVMVVFVGWWREPKASS